MWHFRARLVGSALQVVKETQETRFVIHSHSGNFMGVSEHKNLYKSTNITKGTGKKHFDCITVESFYIA